MIDTPYDLLVIGIFVIFLIAAIEIIALLAAITDNKNISFNFLFFYALFALWGVFTYNSLKEEITTAFENNQELLCNTEPKMIISRSLGFILQNEVFINGEKIIDINYCEVFK